jgi:hypothetical protein
MRCLHSIGPCLKYAAAAAMIGLGAVALAQGSAETPVGPGSLSGVWTNADYPRDAAYNPREHVRRTVDGRLPPLQPWAAELLEKRVKASESGRVFASMKSQCLPPGMPAMMFPAGTPIQILETPGQVSMLVEEPNFFRIIHLNQKHAADPDPSFMGDSVGHWEGDTLVVDTIGLTDKTTIDAAGMPHSEDLHVIERLRRAAKDTLEDLITIDDPKTFTSTWTTATHFRLRTGMQIMEYICQNNRNLADENGQIGTQLPAASR